MATKKKTKKSEHQLLESSEALAEKLSTSEQWIEDHKTLVYSVIGVIALVIAGVLFYRNHLDSQNQLAQNEMFQAQYWFEQDSLALALNGDGNNYGFIEIIDNYGNTKAGNLANFYAGAAYLKQGDFDSAIDYLMEFNANDKLVQGRAYQLIGDAYMEKGEYAEAANFYGKAADYYPNEYFTPDYLLKQALAYEQLAEYDKAIEAYDKIINEYSKSSKIQNARKHRARVESLSSK